MNGPIFRSHYVILICLDLILASDTKLNPVEFDWNSVDSVLLCPMNISLHYQRCTLLPVATKKMHWEMSAQQIFIFHKTIKRLTNL